MIRVAKATDAFAILKIYRPIVKATAISFEFEVPTLVEMEDRIRRTLKKYPWIVFEMSDKVVGYAYASTFRARVAYQWSPEVTVYVEKEYWGLGIGKKLYKALFEILMKQGYCNVIGCITLPNVASETLHQKFGFTKVAVFPSVGYKLGQWHDVGFWQLELQSKENNPAEPISFSRLIKNL